jgi:uncharacterized cupin superfamily protein
MSDFAHVNLLEIDSSVPAGMEGVEGRFSRKYLGSRDLGVSHFRYEPGYRASRGHRHREQEEAYVVVGGSGRILLDGEVRDLSRWDVVRVAPAVMRAFEAGPEGLELIAIGGRKPPDGDVENMEIEWPAGDG